MKAILLTWMLFLLVTLSFSQTKIKGNITENQSGIPIRYVNIGIINKNTGTVSDYNGEYELVINNEYFNDSIRFSSIGYLAQTYLVKDFIKHANFDVGLTETTYRISEVIIKPQKYKVKQFGDRLRYGFPASYGVDQLGHELGIKINLNQRESMLQDFNFLIADNLCDTLLFRLNIYTIKDSVPDHNILTENIIINSSIKKGYIKVDLTKYNIVLKEDFVISIEWIKEYNNKDCIYFRVRPGFSTVPVFVKQTSEGTWKETKKFGVEFFVNVRKY